MNSISDIQHAYYINLDSRPDRKQHIERQLDIIGIKAERFKAIKLTNGALGCSMSHLKLLEMAKANNFPHILIVEDDLLFTNPSLFVNKFTSFLKTHKAFDVVLVAGNNMLPFKVIDDTCIKVSQCQTTTGYLVQQHYYDILIENYRTGIELLIKNQNEHILYAIDKYWFSLQKMHNWYLIIPLTVIQREDYSDIEKRTTNYSHVMLDLDKEAFYKFQMEQQRKINLSKMKFQIDQYAKINLSKMKF
jgi:glycosyl transferase family 25